VAAFGRGLVKARAIPEGRATEKPGLRQVKNLRTRQDSTRAQQVMGLRGDAVDSRRNVKPAGWLPEPWFSRSSRLRTRSASNQLKSTACLRATQAAQQSHSFETP
jgi:hypothetical protein